MRYLTFGSFTAVLLVVFLLTMGVLVLVQFADVFYLNFFGLALALTIGGALLLAAFILVSCWCGTPRRRMGLSQRRDITVFFLAAIVGLASGIIVFWTYDTTFGSSGDRDLVGYLAFTQAKFSQLVFVGPLAFIVYAGVLAWASLVEPRLDLSAATAAAATTLGAIEMRAKSGRQVVWRNGRAY
jgi:hypothetical protein